jgi:hypothetical protein
MRLNLSHEQTIRGGAKPIQSNVHKTTVNNTIFRIVTKGLYIRPIEAIVREICTNALDGHIAAGTPEVPFDVTLPSVLNPYFIVRDYGISMDNDTVFNVYAVLGESTKNATSNSIGGWGVGGKSPAAYSDTFFITTYKDGVRRIYQSSCLQNSTPLELLLQGFTDQKDGVEVKIPIKSEDFRRFIKAAESQIAPFDVKPNILSGLSTDSEFKYQYDLTKAKTFNITPNLYLPDDSGELVKSPVKTPVYIDCTNDKLAVRMGCVVYPINVTSEFFEQYDEKLKAIKDISGSYNFLIDLPVDTVDIKPSREDLDYTERTNAVLTAVISSLYKHYLKQAISIAFQARLLPSNDAIQHIFNNSSGDGMIKYIMNKYSTKPDFSDVRMKYARIPEKFSQYIYQTKSDFNKDRHLPFEFSVCDGTTTKKISNSDVKFWYTISRSITLIKRSTGYIKKFNYWSNEGELPESGLVNKHNVSRGVSYSRESMLYTKRDFLVNGSSHKYIVINDDELDDAVTFLEKIFQHVEVVELEDLPKKIKELNRSSNQYNALRYMDTNVYTFEGKKENYNESGYYSISYLKNRCEQLVDKFDNETVFTIHDSMHMDKSVLSSLCKYHKINVVIFDLPDSFSCRVLKSKNVKFIPLETIINTMLGKITNEVNAEWKQQLIKRFEYTYVHDKLSYSSKLKAISTVRQVRDYFFKFAPKFAEKPEYCVLASKLLTVKDRFYLEREAERVVERMEKRLKLLLNRRPTLALIDNYTDDPLIVELFKLNFKGFNPDANK